MNPDTAETDPLGAAERRRIVIASMVGTTIEFYDFYIYATAAVSVFPALFFPKGNPTTALLASLATFGLAFVARPLGSVLFGHFGDRVGRKATLVGSLLTMGIATFAIGLLPTYHQVGLLTPALLAVLCPNQPMRARNSPLAIRKPIGAPSCGHIAAQARFPGRAVSVASNAAPLHSPPNASPWVKRNTASSAGASSPT